MSTMHVTCFLYLMIVIKHGRPFFKNSSFFKKLQCGILSGPETGRSFRATFWFVFTKPRPTPSACVVLSSGCHLMQLGIVERYILLLKCHEWIRHRENIVCVHFEVNKIFLCSCDLDGFRYCLYCPTILEEVSWRLVQTTV